MKGLNEKLLLDILNTAYPNKWIGEHRGIPDRQFRFDAANLSDKICIEIEGGIWLGNKGGHTSGIGYEQNLEKYNLVTIHGWKLLRYSPSMLKKHPEQILLDVMAVSNKVPEKLTTKNDIRAKISETKTFQVKIS